MDVGIGLPDAVRGTGGPVPADGARRAEQAGLGGGSPDMFAQAATAPDKARQDAARAAVSQAGLLAQAARG
jgi:hypothetical protein